MSGQGFKDVMKNGWHPKGKDGQKESWRSDFKGVNTVAGWMGKGKDPNEAAREHVSTPLSSLKDPNSFAPPPKHIHYHGAAAAPNRTTPDTSGWGAPLSQTELRNQQIEAQRAEEEVNKPKPPPVPYRVNTTGLETSHLPPPPKRTDGADGRTPSPSANPKPNLPPRLPPRQNSSSASVPTLPPPPAYSAVAPEPPSHQGILNQGSLNRLGAAGVSVPGFGIGDKTPPQLPSRTSTASPKSASGWSKNISSLADQTRSLSISSPPSSEPPSEGTSFAQKRAALQTASAFKKDPSAVSFSDARNAASVANNFRQRHGDQVAAGVKSANDLNTKYGLSEKVGGFTPPPPPRTPARSPEPPAKPSVVYSGEHVTAFKKKPPPPPVKKATLKSTAAPNAAGPAPPPIPYASKPPPAPSPAPSHDTAHSVSASGSWNQDLDLDLNSLWFAQNPIRFPPPSFKKYKNLGGHTWSSGWSSNGVRKTFTFTGAVRHTDSMAITLIHLTWDSSNPGHTVKPEQRHIPPPRTPSPHELDEWGNRYSEEVARWCEARLGVQVGNGECWTLANDALKAVAAECPRRGVDPCIPSQGLSHGALLYHFNPASGPEPQGGVVGAGVRRGDVIQLLTAHFVSPNGGQSWAGAPDHTVVIQEVGQDGVVQVLGQNNNGNKTVAVGHYNFGEMKSGDVKIFRAAPESWAGKLEARWD